ncbi:COX15/CtaA family protein [Pseudomonas oligotrophica]|uniref:COX15/CtaA family protein n=1 Tax=Pseudomonas oligotrophica TaxID=2912055 RepID=UPI001F3DA9B6|nr:COX15/CtaA family protein [Pseudomonas oligotrophica]MCF7200581.1 COX15/CtaA family protein [Pseudomonas oligotrophica]
MPPTPRPGYRLALIATALAVAVVLLGAYTRLTHAGLGCPDWPGCYGFLAVPMSESQQALAAARFPEAPLEVHKGWNEMVHRYFAGSLGLLILALALQALRHRGQPGQPLKLPLVLLAVVIAQALFGMWTVTLQLWPQVVTAHLLGGFTTLALLLLLSLRMAGRWPALPGVPARLRLFAGAALALVVLQIALGGWVSSNYAAVACTDFPTCHGQWWPPMDFARAFDLTHHEIGPNYLGGLFYGEARTAIHVGHRLGALTVALLLPALAWQLRRHGFGRLAALLLGALALQLGLGIGNVLLHLPLAVAVAHNGGGALLLLVLVTINYRLRALPASVAANAARPPLPPRQGGIELPGV